MAPPSSTHNQLFSQSQSTPLPDVMPDTEVTFQSWHEFDSSTQQWSRVDLDSPSASHTPEATHQSDSDDFNLVTWNVDAFSAIPAQRLSGIISHVLSLTPTPDIIFLQEVPAAGLSFLLNEPRIRESWFSSEADLTNWRGGLPFATTTLLSRSRFGYGGDDRSRSRRATLGAVWRVKYPSRFRRDALCCDVFVPASAASASAATPPPPSDTASSTTTAVPEPSRVRLINVHLDSLAYQPSLRPGQLSAAAAFLRSAGRGIVAGDFNPVLPEDETLVADVGLEDAWLVAAAAAGKEEEDPGFTWGVDGKAAFPPCRMDKIATLGGLRAREVRVMHPGSDVEVDSLNEDNLPVADSGFP
ncbi:hypothetical protein QBC33DRAFT_514794 [Phialemonium atrogriseum]|uniref:Endonuclease/exonuclease/phosphatase domain-containing protein n=1 Tax=Phialemonium atrogriseum TaxID=1093897 RepID=A0AAJ0C0G2_9PEZI|nr:uncharacterized protein QBC33DRAFT_514794 [Phialemonium atrogriseum]KAK1767888.1 hypothetical protein QBC33DRAFT_514794 [Phialemonium atrogriseum]